MLTCLVLGRKHACDSCIQNVLVVSEDTDVIVLLLEDVELLNGQLFQKSETQNCQRFLDIKQLQNGFSSNLVGLINGLRLLKKVNKFKKSLGC